MSVKATPGEDCSRCPSARKGKVPLKATTHGLCQRCWLGSTESQRRAAVFEHDDSIDVHARFEAFYEARCAARGDIVGP